MKKPKVPIVLRFRRVTHSRYECGKAAWTNALPATGQFALWNMLPEMEHMYALGCPY